MPILKPENINYIAIHCSATSPDKLIGVKEINDMHLANGWSEIGYHIVIRRDLGSLGGYIEYGRSLNLVGAHVQGFNDESLGVCLVGGVDKNNKPENNFIKNQFNALQKTLIFLTAIFPKAIVQGHNSFPGVRKACPCFQVEDWWRKNKFVESNLSMPKPVLADIFEW